MKLSVLLFQMKELEEEWAKLDSSPPKPTRLTRSQQEKQAQAPQVDEETGSSAGVVAEEGIAILLMI